MTERDPSVLKPVSGFAKLRPQVKGQLFKSPQKPSVWQGSFFGITSFPLACAFVALVGNPRLSENVHTKPYCLLDFMTFSQKH